jgi:hypothetical protein
MMYEKQVTELFKKIVELPTLEERVAARDTILNALDDHKWKFREEEDFVLEYDCGNCNFRFEEWELEPGEMQPPSMPGQPLCRSCWDTVAEKRWAGE